MARGRTKPSKFERVIRRRIGLQPGQEFLGAELSALASGTRPEAVAQRRKAMRILHKNPAFLLETLEGIRYAIMLDLVSQAAGRRLRGKSRYHTSRPSRYYNQVFSPFLPAPLIDTLAALKKKKRPIKILEDGAGEKATFLAVVKRALLKRGIKSETTAITLTESDALKRRKRKLIDHVFVGSSEEFLPKGKYDAIVSVGGSIHHSHPAILRENLLKYCYALEKGGIALINFRIPKEFNNAEAKERIKANLKKRGFKAEFHDLTEAFEWLKEENIPKELRQAFKKASQGFMLDVLIIRRVH